MFKPKTLLKVMSVLMIISGVLGLIGTITGAVLAPKLGDMAGMEGVDMSVITSAYTPLNIVLALISSLGALVAGIFGVTGKSFKVAAIAMGIYTAVLLINTIQSIMGGTFSMMLVVDYILPALYWWGLYQSKE